MDFFESQDIARRNTTRLVFYFILAVILIIAAVYLAFAFTFQTISAQSAARQSDQLGLWQPGLFVIVSCGTLALVCLGSLYRIYSLKEGGEAVARMLGGRLISPETKDPAERRLLNVVEEMAIASGTPVPPVYLLKDEAINAFAAGFATNDAVIGVTEGCMNRLSRDELQGVIAHEFSHILNGDMRLNIRLMGILHGILLIGIAGYYLSRLSIYKGDSRSGSDRKGGGGMAIIILGLSLYAIGYIGVFFGKLIKSAVSRQREFLADAAAVQFTRYPDGIAGALKKLGGFSMGSRLQSSNAEQASHLFFGNALASSFTQMMSTHPPLGERIKRIDPHFDDDFSKVSTQPIDFADEERSYISRLDSGGEIAVDATKLSLDPSQVASQIGSPRPEHLTYAATIKASLPNEILSLAHEASGARAVVYAILLNQEPEPQQCQLQQLKEHADQAVFNETLRIATAVCALPAAYRLPLIDMALPALRTLSDKQYQTFRQNVEFLVAADKEVDLFEYTLQRILLRHLHPAFAGVDKKTVRHHSLKPLQTECRNLLGTLAHVGHVDIEEAGKAFAKGCAKLQTDTSDWVLPHPDECSLENVDKALDALTTLAAALKRQVIEACATCIAADEYVSVHEAELFRAIADSLDCPMPPLIGGQSLVS